MTARGKRKAVDLTVCISPKKKEARDKAAAKEHGKTRGKAKKQKTSKKKATGKAAGRKRDYSSLKRCMTNRRRWGFKGGPKTHELLKWSELSVNHLKDLKDDVRPLTEGESLMNVLQQDGEIQEASDLLSELKPEMKRAVGNFHMKVTPICFSATARKKMPCFNKLAVAIAHVDSTSWFIVVSPPMKALDSIEKRLPTDPDSKAKRKGKLVGNVRSLWHVAQRLAAPQERRCAGATTSPGC
jgi:hypothetical protein